MRITVSLLPDARLPEDLQPSETIAVVVDVLRATSVMATALAHGAEQIITFETIDQARQWKQATEPAGPQVLLCGERQCQRIEGFDLGNSPPEYSPQRVAGKTLVMTTTNGTRALAAASPFQQVLTASFLNFSATLERLAGAACVHVFCAGTDGFITAEDTLLAGALVLQAAESWGARAGNDEATLAANSCQQRIGDSVLQNREKIPGVLLDTRGGRALHRLGFDSDIRRCGQLDTLSVVPTVVGRQPIVLKS